MGSTADYIIDRMNEVKDDTCIACGCTLEVGVEDHHDYCWYCYLATNWEEQDEDSV